jgi:hypothetical protein
MENFINYVTVFNLGYIEFAKNNVINFINVISNDNCKLTLVSLDDFSFEEMRNYINSIDHKFNTNNIELKKESINNHEFADFNSKGFIDIMHKKINVVISEVKNSNIVHYFDGDVVFFKDPYELITTSLSNHDIVFQQDAPVVHHNNQYHTYVCAGNFSIKNNKRSLDFLNKIASMLHSGQNDQEVLYDYLRSLCDDIRNYSNCKLDAYDQELFQNGFDAFQNNWHTKDNKISIHANHMIGKQLKLNALKLASAWYI